jgi:hypothetical protein
MEWTGIARTFGLFFATAIAELIGCYLPLLWVFGCGLWTGLLLAGATRLASGWRSAELELSLQDIPGLEAPPAGARRGRLDGVAGQAAAGSAALASEVNMPDQPPGESKRARIASALSP